MWGEQPHAIDEWQDVPSIWDEVRYRIDETGNRSGQFILTGSSKPNEDRLQHSGAGRIATYRMSTMTLAETGESSGAISLAGLFGGRFEPQLAHQRLEPYARIICRGGWPALRPKATGTGDYVSSYLDALFATSITRRGLDGRVARRVARSLARNSGKAVKFSTVAADAEISGADPKASASVASSYVSELVRLYVVDEVSGWDAPIRSRSQLRTKPKRYFADSSLAVSLLGITQERLMSDGQLFGLLFESLAMHDLRVYASALPGAPADSLHYYRDSDGLEVDAIIELTDGRWAGIEVKLGEDKLGEAIASLDRLRRKVARNPMARNPAPAFMAVLVGAGELARYDKEADVYVMPLTCLGP